jgi:8-amino-7-oxononanoate synthase
MSLNRDGIKLSNSKAYKFAHNDFEELETLLKRHHKGNGLCS